MPKKLKFGGANLVKGQHTWYEYRKPDGTDGVQRADVGHLVDANVPLAPNDADYFVQAGMAEIVDSVLDAPAQPQD